MKLTLDPIADSNGYSTIRLADGTPHGDTEAQPIATVYNNDYAAVLAASTELAEALGWFVSFCAEHPEWADEQFPADSAEGEWLENARHALQKAGLVS